MRSILVIVVGMCCAGRAAEPPVNALVREVAGLGWIAFSAATEAGDWDLFVMRPDGSSRHKLIDTREYNEAGARFSPDGKRLLYYRMPSSEPVDNNTYGTFEFMLADSNGAHPVSLGAGYPWASWAPDGRAVAVLKPAGIQVVDVTTRQVLRTFARKGLVQQLV